MTNKTSFSKCPSCGGNWEESWTPSQGDFLFCSRCGARPEQFKKIANEKRRREIIHSKLSGEEKREKILAEGVQAV